MPRNVREGISPLGHQHICAPRRRVSSNQVDISPHIHTRDWSPRLSQLMSDDLAAMTS